MNKLISIIDLIWVNCDLKTCCNNSNDNYNNEFYHIKFKSTFV